MWFTFAIGAAFFFGLRGIFYQWSSHLAIDRNLLFASVYVSSTILSIVINIYMQQSWNQMAWIGILMGIFSFIANTALYKGYAIGRASVIAFFSGLTPIFVVLIASLLWKETLSMIQLIGFSIIILSLFIMKYNKDVQQGHYKGWQWGLLAILFYSFTDLASKQALLYGAYIMPTLTSMFITCSILFSISYIISNIKKDKIINDTVIKQVTSSSQNSWTIHKIFLLGIGMGLINITAMILKLAAFHTGITGVVSAIIALSIIIVMIYARLYLKESINRAEVYGLILALIGIVIIKGF